MDSDLIKIALLLPYYALAAPALGFLLRGRPRAQQLAVAVLCFTTIEGIMGPANWSLTLSSTDEAPRSHTKGFYFFFNVALAMALVLAKYLEDRRSFRWLPPGLGWYLGYCGLSLLSLVSAFNPAYVFMAAHKHLIVAWVMLAVFNAVRTDEDIANVIRAFVVTMTWQMIVCLKLKYYHGIYQVHGTFEHQNSLGTYAVLIGMVMLAVAFGPKTNPPSRALWGFLASAVVVQATVSRGSMGAFAAGVVTVVVVSLLRNLQLRTLAIASSLALVGALGLTLTLDTIISRFHDSGNLASGQLREIMNAASRDMVRDYPFGVGWNNYALAANRPYPYAEHYEQLGGLQAHPDHHHAVVESHYYLLLSETGYVGLIGWLAVIGTALLRNIRAFFAFGYSFRGMLSLGIATGCVCNYAQSTLERTLTQPRNLMLFLILLAVTARLEVLRREQRRAAGLPEHLSLAAGP